MKRIKRAELTTYAMVVKRGEKRITRVILDGTVRNWVGIGWVDEGPPTPHQTRTLPKVID